MKRQSTVASVIGAGLLLATAAVADPYNPGERALGGGLLGAGTGAVIGAIAGGGKGAGIGAAVGGGAGAGSEIITKGEQVKIPSETLLEFTLQQEVSVPKPRG